MGRGRQPRMGQRESVSDPPEGSVGPSMTTTLHRHPLVYEPCSYSEGTFICDRCSRHGRRSYHCDLCRFDLCNSCARDLSHRTYVPPPSLSAPEGSTLMTPMHDHLLTYGRCKNPSGRFVCSLCQGLAPKGYSCNVCHFDLCDVCARTQSFTSPLHQHALTYGYSPYREGRFICDHCRKSDTLGYNCFQCRFDLCERCALIRGHSAILPLTGPVGPTLSSPVHPHKLTYRKSEPPLGRYFCNMCGHSGSVAYNCQSCEYNVCHDCSRLPIHRSRGLGPGGKNARGRPMQQSYDSVHQKRLVFYCGQIVGQKDYHNPCGRCDGRCGPSNGCQCVWCYEANNVPLAVEELQTDRVIPFARTITKQTLG